MARAVLSVVVFLCLLSNAPAQVVQQPGYKVSKVNHEFLDADGNTTDEIGNAVSEAKYQRQLERSGKFTGIRFSVLWKAPSTPTPNLTIKLEARGRDSQGRQTSAVRFKSYPTKRHFSGWAILDIDGDSFKRFGELRAWRVSISQNGQVMAERKSFLWDDLDTTADDDKKAPAAGTPATASPSEKSSAAEEKPAATESTEKSPPPTK